jgi:hypothetical protein
MDTKDYFNLVNTSNYIQNINQGKTGLMIIFMQTKQKHNQTIWTEGKYNAATRTTRFNYVSR